MTDISLRYLIAALLIAVVSAIPFIGMDDWIDKDTEFDTQVSPNDLDQEHMDTQMDNGFPSIAGDINRMAPDDLQIPQLQDNGLVPTHRGKRFGFSLLPLGFRYRMPTFPRRNRRINSRNYVAMRGKRLNQYDFGDLESFGHKADAAVSKRRGFTALRGR